MVPRPRVELGKTDYKSVIIPFNYRGNIQSAFLKISSLIIKNCCMHFKNLERPVRIGLTSKPWQGFVLPLYDGRIGRKSYRILLSGQWDAYIWVVRLSNNGIILPSSSVGGMVFFFNDLKPSSWNDRRVWPTLTLNAEQIEFLSALPW